MDVNKIRNILNAVFMIMAVAAVIIYYASDNFKLFIYVCGTAVFVKIMEYFIRFTHR